MVPQEQNQYDSLPRRLAPVQHRLGTAIAANESSGTDGGKPGMGDKLREIQVSPLPAVRFPGHESRHSGKHCHPVSETSREHARSSAGAYQCQPHSEEIPATVTGHNGLAGRPSETRETPTSPIQTGDTGPGPPWGAYSEYLVLYAWHASLPQPSFTTRPDWILAF